MPNETNILIYQTEEGELEEVATCKYYLQVQNEGERLKEIQNTITLK